MKNNILLPTVLFSLFLCQANAQAGKSIGSHFTDSLENLTFEQLESYIHADTFNIKLEEAEKFSHSHLGEQHTLILPANRGSGTEENSYVSWDKWLPTVYNKEATVGSPFLLFLYVPGLVVNNALKIVHIPDYRYNYDKMSGNLLLIRNGERPIAVYKDQVKMFCLKTDKGGLIFMRVPQINNSEFFQVLYKGTKYSVYKLYKNEFVQANQNTNGYISEGKDYDEYQDVVTYYLVDEQKEAVYTFELNRKSVRQIFGAVSNKANQYFQKEKYLDISEDAIAHLTEALNQ